MVRAAIPVLPWERAIVALAATMKQGEHVSILGSTGAGKTSVARRILPLRRYAVTLATKPRDDSLEGFIRDGWHRSRKWPVDPRRHPRVVYWPKPGRLGDVARQADHARQLLEQVWQDGGWTVYWDELRYACKQLGLQPEIEQLYLQGRAMGITMVGASQRPAWVPLEAYSEASHLILLRTNDRRNLDRLGEIGGEIDAREISAAVGTLRRYELLYVGTRTGALWRTTPPAPD